MRGVINQDPTVDLNTEVFFYSGWGWKNQVDPRTGTVLGLAMAGRTDVAPPQVMHDYDMGKPLTFTFTRLCRSASGEDDRRLVESLH